MSGVNYAYLKSLIQSRLELYGLRITDRVAFYLNRVIRDVEGGNTALAQTLKDKGPLALTNEETSLSLPNLIINQPFTVSVRPNGSMAEPYPVHLLQRHSVNSQVSRDIEGSPTYFTVEPYTEYDNDGAVLNPNAARLRFYPTPDQEYDVFITGHFFSILPDWEDESTNWLILNEPDLLKYGITSYIAGDQNAEERSQVDWELYRVELRGDLENHGKDGLITRMDRASAPQKGYGFELYRAPEPLEPEFAQQGSDPHSDPHLVIQQIPLLVMTRAQANVYILTVPNERKMGTTYIGQEDNKLYTYRDYGGVLGWHPFTGSGGDIVTAGTGITILETDPSRKIVSVRSPLPVFPTEGSRDTKLVKFVENTLTWQEDIIYEEATADTDGLLSAEDKAKLDGIEAEATVGIVYEEATADTDGLLSAEDKAKLDGIEAEATAGTDFEDDELRAALRRLGLVLPNAQGNLPAAAADGSDDASIGIQHGRLWDINRDLQPGHGANVRWTLIGLNTNIGGFPGHNGTLRYRGIHDRGSTVGNAVANDFYSTYNAHFFRYHAGNGGLLGWWPIDPPNTLITGSPFPSEAAATAHCTGNNQLTIWGSELRRSSEYVAPVAQNIIRAWEVSDPSPPNPRAIYYGDGAISIFPTTFPYTVYARSNLKRGRFAANGPHRIFNNWEFGDIIVPLNDVSNDLDTQGAPSTAERVVFQPPAGRWSIRSHMREAGTDTGAAWLLQEITNGNDDIVVAAGVTYGSANLSGNQNYGLGSIAVLELPGEYFDGSKQIYFLGKGINPETGGHMALYADFEYLGNS